MSLYHAIGFAADAKPFTRNFDVALEGLRDAADRTKRWLDTHHQQPAVATRYAEAIIKIRFQIDPQRLAQAAPGYGEVFGKAAQKTLSDINEDMISRGYIDFLPQWSEYSYHLAVIKEHVGLIDDATAFSAYRDYLCY